MAMLKFREEAPSGEKAAKPKYEFQFTSVEQIISIGSYVKAPYQLTGMDGQSITPLRAEKLSDDEFRIHAMNGSSYSCMARKDGGYRVEVFLEKNAPSSTAFVAKAEATPALPYNPPSAYHANATGPTQGFDMSNCLFLSSKTAGELLGDPLHTLTIKWRKDGEYKSKNVDIISHTGNGIVFRADGATYLAKPTSGGFLAIYPEESSPTNAERAEEPKPANPAYGKRAPGAGESLANLVPNDELGPFLSGEGADEIKIELSKGPETDTPSKRRAMVRRIASEVERLNMENPGYVFELALNPGTSGRGSGLWGDREGGRKFVEKGHFFIRRAEAGSESMPEEPPPMPPAPAPANEGKAWQPTTPAPPSAGEAKATPGHSGSYQYNGLNITGDTEGKVAKALDELKKADPDEWAFVCDSLAGINISQSNQDWTMYRVFYLNSGTYSDYSPKNLAHTIAHEAMHAHQEADPAIRNRGMLGKDAEMAEHLRLELEATRHELEVAKKLKIPKGQLAQIEQWIRDLPKKLASEGKGLEGYYEKRKSEYGQ